MLRKLNSLVIPAAVLTSMLLIATIVGPASAASKLQYPSSVIKQLSAKWWQWAFSFTTDNSPLSDTSGERCNKGDLGKVFFLAGTAGPISSTQTRDCTISHKDAILIPVANVACVLGNPCDVYTSPLPPQPTNTKELKKQVSSVADRVQVSLSEATITIDGQIVKLNPERVQSPFFKTTVVPDNPLSEPPIKNAVAFADGYWVLLKPLSIGEHTLHFKGVFDLGQSDFVTELTYHITVV